MWRSKNGGAWTIIHECDFAPTSHYDYGVSLGDHVCYRDRSWFDPAKLCPYGCGWGPFNGTACPTITYTGI